MNFTDFWPLILQTAVIVFAIGAGYVRTRERIVILETRASHAEKSVDSLVDKVEGLSIHVAKMEGLNKRTS